MATSFVLNLANNEQEITSDGATTKQKGEFIIKGFAEHNIPPEGDETPEDYTIYIDLPDEMFNYAANVLGVSNVSLEAQYDEDTDIDTVSLIFTSRNGVHPK